METKDFQAFARNAEDRNSFTAQLRNELAQFADGMRDTQRKAYLTAFLTANGWPLSTSKASAHYCTVQTFRTVWLRAWNTRSEAAKQAAQAKREAAQAKREAVEAEIAMQEQAVLLSLDNYRLISRFACHKLNMEVAALLAEAVEWSKAEAAEAEAEAVTLREAEAAKREAAEAKHVAKQAAEAAKRKAKRAKAKAAEASNKAEAAKAAILAEAAMLAEAGVA